MRIFMPFSFSKKVVLNSEARAGTASLMARFVRDPGIVFRTQQIIPS
jgi:hypothetical protein